jgi:phage shock protein C
MSTDANHTERQGRPLRRAANGRILGGVAAGLSKYFGLDVAHVRVALVVLSFIGGAAVPIYLAAWVLVPMEGSDIAIANGFLNHAAGQAS